jgi:hypothetical protein
MMKKLLSLLLIVSCVSAHSQVITTDDLINITSLSDKKLSSYMSKLNFAQTARNVEEGAVVNEFFYNNKKNPTDTIMRFVSGYRRGKITGSIFQTSSYEEFYRMLYQFKAKGFIGGNPRADSLFRYDSTFRDTSTFFQKEDMTINTKEEIKDDIKVYKIVLEKKPVPTGNSIRFAEDLLLFDSHENLVALFGSSNVRRDMFYFSQQDSSRCSVLFPNTPRQAIYIWDDQVQDRVITFLMIGGGLRPKGSSDFDQSMALNSWRSYSGLSTGMRMAEMLRINEMDFNFFGSSSEFALMVVPEKKGNIDFKKLGITFGCLNCSGSPLMKKEKISAEAAIAAGLQLYIVSMVLMP